MSKKWEIIIKVIVSVPPRGHIGISLIISFRTVLQDNENSPLIIFSQFTREIFSHSICGGEKKVVKRYSAESKWFRDGKSEEKSDSGRYHWYSLHYQRNILLFSTSIPPPPLPICVTFIAFWLCKLHTINEKTAITRASRMEAVVPQIYISTSCRVQHKPCGEEGGVAWFVLPQSRVAGSQVGAKRGQ